MVAFFDSSLFSMEKLESWATWDLQSTEPKPWEAPEVRATFDTLDKALQAWMSLPRVTPTLGDAFGEGQRLKKLRELLGALFDLVQDLRFLAEKELDRSRAGPCLVVLRGAKAAERDLKGADKDGDRWDGHPAGQKLSDLIEAMSNHPTILQCREIVKRNMKEYLRDFCNLVQTTIFSTFPCDNFFGA
eukprot:8889444-Pyramimonas_sp.AAC.1